MPSQIPQSFLNKINWNSIGSGSFNKAYLSQWPFGIGERDCYWVLKIPKHKGDFYDAFSEKERAVRKWKELNPTLPAYETDYGWLVPYLGKTPATDAQISRKVVDIYRDTGNLLLDAPTHHNFLIFDEEVVCVDVDYALRRKSIVSDSYDLMDWITSDYLARCASKPQTVSVIRTLIYVQSHLTVEQIKKSYISYAIIQKLHVLRRTGVKLTVKLMDRLETLVDYDTTNEFPEAGLMDFLQIERLTAPAENGKLHAIHVAAMHGFLALATKLVTGNPALIHVRDRNNHNALLCAAHRSQDEVVKFLIARGATVNLSIPFAPADMLLTPTIIRTLLYIQKSLPEASVKSEYITPQMLAKLHVLHKAGKVLNAGLIDSLGELVRFDAAKAISDDRLIEFIDAGSLTAPLEEGKQHIIHLAARYGLLTLVEALITNNREFIHVRNSSNETALILAACNGHDAVVASLLAQGANVNATIRFTPTGLVLTSPIIRALRYLQQYLSDTDIKSGYLSPLILAKVHVLRAAKKVLTVELMEWLLRLIDLDTVNAIPDEHLVEFLDNYSTNKLSEDGKLHVIHLAAKYGLLSLVEKFVGENPRLAKLTDGFNESPLLWAASQGQTAVVNFLLAQGGDVSVPIQMLPSHQNYASLHGLTALDLAVANKHSATIAVLADTIVTSKMGSDISASKKNAVLSTLIPKLPALRQARRILNTDTFERLLELIEYDTANEITDVFVNAFISAGRMNDPAVNGKPHVIHVAVNFGLLSLVKDLIRRDPTLLGITNYSGMTPLSNAVWNGHDAVAKFLLDQGANIYGVNDNINNYPLLNAVLFYKPESTIAVFADAIVSRLASRAMVSKKATILPVFIAKLKALQRFKTLNDDIMQKLLELIAYDIANEISNLHLIAFLDMGMSAPAEDGKTHVIHLAAKYGLIELITTLTIFQPELIHVKDATSNATPLAWAASYGQDAVVKFLLIQCAAVNPVMKWRTPSPQMIQGEHTPLDLALKNKHPSTADILRRAGAIAILPEHKTKAAPVAAMTQPLTMYGLFSSVIEKTGIATLFQDPGKAII